MKQTSKSLIILAAISSAAHSATLTNGSLTVEIRDDNGAIDSVLFGGTDYFNPGIPVSDWGFQTSTDTNTFVVNTTSGGTGQTVTVSGGVVTGIYNKGGAVVAFSREYSLVPGANTLRIDMTYLNLGPTITIRQFETFDPDQGTNLGMGPTTWNDVFALDGTSVAQARIQGTHTHAVILGSRELSYTVAAGAPFQIDSGAGLNDFFTSPFDGNDGAADGGIHLGFERTIINGGAISYSSFLSFGLNPASAQSSFVNAVPEPSTIALGVLGISALLRRRRRAGARQSSTERQERKLP